MDWKKLLLGSGLEFVENSEQIGIFNELTRAMFWESNEIEGDLRDILQQVLDRIDAPSQSEACWDAVNTYGLGLPKSVLDLLVPLAILSQPLHFSFDAFWGRPQLTEITQLEAYHFFMSLPREQISNRQELLHHLLSEASSVIVALLLDLPFDEIEDRPMALKERIDSYPMNPGNDDG
ncbi:MAG: hypothetical protein AAGM67_21700, partial [Bacteroidota bacterium]